jgi:single-stranded-DNA-specific exonuclease
LIAVGLDPLLARILARRGITGPAEATEFLEPSLEALHDPFLLEGMSRAVQSLLRARASGTKVVVVGDYDADGITATALLVAVFQACGLEVEAILPRRLSEGYGFQTTHVEAALERGAGLIVTADCGTHSHAAAAAALAEDIEVLVTDHHLPGAPHDPRVIEINPHRDSCEYPFDGLSGAGLAFKLAAALAELSGRAVDPRLLLRVACLGTIADMVPLVGENRTIASLGLASLSRTRSVGLRALMSVAGVSSPVTAADVGFRLGPRLNAAGRMDSPDYALELLLTREADRARMLAEKLDEWNRLRQQTEADVTEEARGRLLEERELPPLVLEWSPEWHRGVLGIAAGRIAKEFHRPTILLKVEEDLATGSGRSVDGIHLHDFLKAWEERLERFGGHSQAIGMTAHRNRLESLKREWIEAARRWDQELLVPCFRFEERLQPEEVTVDLFELIQRFEPFGIGNPRPLFRLGPLTLNGRVRRFGKNHIGARALGSGGSEVELVGWGWEERAGDLTGSFEVLARVGYDRFYSRPTLELADVRPC